MVLNIQNPEQLADFLAPNLNVEVAQKQSILEELDVEKRVRAVQKQISAQLEIAQIQEKLQKDVAIAVYGRTAPRVFAFADQSHSTRVGRG